MRLKQNTSDGNVGFQIAPMIDVVFVIMLFFMVMAGAVKVESELNTTLPGSAETSNNTDFTDEVIIAIAENGQVSLNDDEMDKPDDPALPQLLGTLLRLKQASDAAKSHLTVTIASEPKAKYGRAIDVLNALAAARVDNVTFTTNEDE